uniref:Uncharacterized protein n=1 Tax=Romanomermis culicivorax TaxID=13658 RepID=A0A915IUE3_ROMCU
MGMHNKCTRMYNATDDEVQFGRPHPRQNNRYFLVDGAIGLAIGKLTPKGQAKPSKDQKPEVAASQVQVAGPSKIEQAQAAQATETPG